MTVLDMTPSHWAYLLDQLTISPYSNDADDDAWMWRLRVCKQYFAPPPAAHALMSGIPR